MQWARANGCDWDADTCQAAAAGGHLAVLQWVRANGCPWDRGGCLGTTVYTSVYDDPVGAAPAGSEIREWIQTQPA